MAKFTYTVQDAQCTVTTGSVEADSEEAVVEELQRKGLFILTIEAESPGGGGFKRLYRMGEGGISGREMVFFGEQLATLLGGGIPLVRALSLLSEHTESRALGVLVTSITKEVSSGNPLHKALAKHPKVFDELWVSLVQAGEMSGQLPAVFRRITAYNEAQENLKSKIITAVSYPAVLFTMALGVLTYFVVYIVPVFSDLFKDFDMQLPLLTRGIVAVSELVSKYFMQMLVGCLGMILCFRAYLATPPGRLTWNHIQFSLPLFGSLLKSMQVERMLTTMSTLIRSGVSILNAVSVLEGAFQKNLVFQSALKRARNDIASGYSISESFRKTGIFPLMVTKMMWMGEESGKLPESIDVLSKFYQEQIDQWLRRFTALIDPILVVGVGGIVAVVVMSIFMPIFRLSQLGAG